MIKTWIFVFATICASSTFANARYDSDTAQNVKSIYWLSKNEDSAIVYARFEGFYSLRDLIDKTILASNTSSKVDSSIDGADKLLLMMPEQENILEIFLTDNHLVFNGLNYQLDISEINKLRAMNDYRIDKGDLISASTLVLARERFGIHR